MADEIGSRYTKYVWNLPIKIIYNKKEKRLQRRYLIKESKI